jgi:hypothetical protein
MLISFTNPSLRYLRDVLAHTFNTHAQTRARTIDTGGRIIIARLFRRFLITLSDKGAGIRQYLGCNNVNELLMRFLCSGTQAITNLRDTIFAYFLSSLFTLANIRIFN